MSKLSLATLYYLILGLRREVLCTGYPTSKLTGFDFVILSFLTIEMPMVKHFAPLMKLIFGETEDD